MPIFAPRLCPPCLICSVVALIIINGDIGPVAIPLVLPTIAPLDLTLDAANPVPPPVL